MTFEKPALNLADYAVVWTNDILAGNNTIKSVNIPHGVVSVGAGAFANKGTLVSVTATESCKRIEPGAFAGCSSLKTVSFPGVQYIGSGAFQSTSLIDMSSGTGQLFRSGLLNFDFPELITLGDGATAAGAGYRTINLPKCKDLGSGNFSRARYPITLENEDGTLNDLKLPNCKRIGSGCCQGLTCKNIILPMIEEIEGGSFKAAKFESFIMSNPAVVCNIKTTFENLTVDDTHGWFYVPRHLLERYKEGCSTVSSRFRAIEDYPEIVNLL